ncbi:hypothetical protein [Pseudomonas savastanoi]|uniref:hypothetical protein n=1 Tax=Pseudomonas savastanoi TaxID=29438 RepID=UPI000F002558|nr:hypothetical protein [Pseudomonas savastanoi]RML92450.1 hypothetical protein ALQ87_02053 [Pseudomonas savastanoi pv. glycinea]
MDLDQMLQNVRYDAAARIFATMGSEEKSQQLLQRVQGQSDAMIDFSARYEGIPADQLEIYRAMVRGQDNAFYDGLSGVDNLLKPGDIILCTGNTVGAKIITKGQKFSYEHARSSHVALIHADFVCVDAMPSLGVSNRLVSDVLTDVKPDWRVIRCKKLGSEHDDRVYQACAFYLAQPYKILPSRKPMKAAAYCSELARKVFLHTGVTGIGVPNDSVLSPGKFDELADNHPQWEDVTEQVRPAIEFCLKYHKLMGITSKLLIEGLKLNRKRFEDRRDQIKKIQLAASQGSIPREKAKELIKSIRAIENDMNHKFWDYSK